MRTFSCISATLLVVAISTLLAGCSQDKERDRRQPVPITEMELDLAVQSGLSSEIKDADSIHQDAIASGASKKEWRDISVTGTFRVQHEQRPPRLLVRIKNSNGAIDDEAMAKLEKTGERQYRFHGEVTAHDRGDFTIEIKSGKKVIATEKVQVE